MNIIRRSSYILFLFFLSCLVFGADVGAQTANPAEGNPDPYAIGCLLPLTGKHSVNGNRAAEAMILSLDLFGAGASSPFKLFVEDTASEAAGVKAAVSRLAGEHKVIAIVGLLSPEEAPAAVEEAQKLGVPIIILSQKEGITEIGDNVFQLALTPQQQIRALVEYCMLDLGMKDFAMLNPHDDYGREMAALFRAEVLKHKGTIKRSRSYKTDQTDFGDEIKAIAPPQKTAARSKKTSREAKEDDEEYRPAIDFDALFIPDAFGRVKMIASQLAFYNVRGVKLLGTNLWNHPDMGGKSKDELGESAADIALEGAVFMDSFTTNSFVREAIEFTDLFFTAYGRNPGTLEAMAYDAAQIARRIVLDYKIASRRAFRERLASLRSYRGATGKTTFADSRSADKSIFTLTIKDGQIIQAK